jgi:hypothetical protein
MATAAEKRAAQAALEAQNAALDAGAAPLPDTTPVDPGELNAGATVDASVAKEEEARLAELAASAPIVDPLDESLIDLDQDNAMAQATGVTRTGMPVGGGVSPAGASAYTPPPVPTPTQVTVMPTEDYRRLASADAARKARSLKSNETVPGGRYGITDAEGNVVRWVDANGFTVEGGE